MVSLIHEQNVRLITGICVLHSKPELPPNVSLICLMVTHALGRTNNKPITLTIARHPNRRPFFYHTQIQHLSCIIHGVVTLRGFTSENGSPTLRANNLFEHLECKRCLTALCRS